MAWRNTGHGNPEAYQCWELWADSCSVLWEREYLSPFKKKKSVTSQTQKQHRKCCWCSGKSRMLWNSCICFAQKPEEKKILIYISKSNWTLEMSEDKCLQKAAAFQQHSPSSMPTTMKTFTPNSHPHFLWPDCFETISAEAEIRSVTTTFAYKLFP